MSGFNQVTEKDTSTGKFYLRTADVGSGGGAPTPSSDNSFSIANSGGVLEASRVVKNAAGKISKAIINVDTTAPTGTYYIQILNASSVPADGAVTHLIDPIVVEHSSGTTDTFPLDFVGADLEKSGVYASTGIVVCLSSTRATKTITSAYLTMTVFYQ